MIGESQAKTGRIGYSTYRGPNDCAKLPYTAPRCTCSQRGQLSGLGSGAAWRSVAQGKGFGGKGSGDLVLVACRWRLATGWRRAGGLTSGGCRAVARPTASARASCWRRAEARASRRAGSRAKARRLGKGIMRRKSRSASAISAL